MIAPVALAWSRDEGNKFWLERQGKNTPWGVLADGLCTSEENLWLSFVTTFSVFCLFKIGSTLQKLFKRYP